MAAKKSIDPTKSVKLDPAAELAQDNTPTGETTEKKKYPRFNIYVNKELYQDFGTYAKSIGFNTSSLISQIMQQTVDNHREEIEEAKRKFEAAKKEYNI